MIAECEAILVDFNKIYLLIIHSKFSLLRESKS